MKDERERRKGRERGRVSPGARFRTNRRDFEETGSRRERACGIRDRSIERGQYPITIGRQARRSSGGEWWSIRSDERRQAASSVRGARDPIRFQPRVSLSVHDCCRRIWSTQRVRSTSCRSEGQNGVAGIGIAGSTVKGDSFVWNRSPRDENGRARDDIFLRDIRRITRWIFCVFFSGLLYNCHLGNLLEG